MCLIILANDVKSLDYKDLETAYDRNKNGFGVMYLDKKENFISGKFVPKNFTELKNSHRNIETMSSSLLITDSRRTD